MKGPFEIRYTTRATSDLKDLYTYLAFSRNEKVIARKLLDRIRKEIRSLDMLPERFRVVDWEPWASKKMRQMTVGRYLIYYQVDTELQKVYIFRVVYGGRDVENILSSE